MKKTLSPNVALLSMCLLFCISCTKTKTYEDVIKTEKVYVTAESKIDPSVKYTAEFLPNDIALTFLTEGVSVSIVQADMVKKGAKKSKYIGFAPLGKQIDLDTIADKLGVEMKEVNYSSGTIVNIESLSK